MSLNYEIEHCIGRGDRKMNYNCERKYLTPSRFLNGTRVMCRNGKWADVVNFSDNTQYLWFGEEEEPLALNMFDKKWQYCIPNVDRVESGAINWDIMEAYGFPATVDDIPLSAWAGERELIWQRVRVLTKEEIEEILGYEIEIFD